MVNAHSRMWNMAINLKNVENEKGNHQEKQYGEKHWKSWKMRNTHCTIWNMVTNMKNVKNEKYTLQELYYGKKIEKPGK